MRDEVGVVFFFIFTFLSVFEFDNDKFRVLLINLS
jgi:hypothetical protein